MSMVSSTSKGNLLPAPNAALHLPLETGATRERRLEAVRLQAGC